MTTLIRWNPLREAAGIQSTLDRLMDEQRRAYRPTWNGATLSLDVQERDNAYTVIANLPGLDAENINISFHDGVLSISAELPQPTVEENTRVLVQERFYGKISRSINLPQPINQDNIEATYEDGVLTLILPKSEDAQPRQIKVKTNGVINASNN